MSFIRGVFLLALLMLVAGVLIGQRLIGPLFAARTLGGPAHVAVVVTSTGTSAPTSVPTPTVRARLRPPASAPTRPHVTVTPAPTATAQALTPTPVPTVRVATHHATGHRRSRPHAQHARAKPTAVLTSTPTPTATATSGMVALDRYWIGQPSAQAGSVISVGYVIDNGTGHTARVMLGASVKSSRTVGWIASIADPSHDVVATAPAGISTHIRYFTLPPRLRSGSYDVAWGLRNVVNGRRDALVFATSALQVAR